MRHTLWHIATRGHVAVSMPAGVVLFFGWLYIGALLLWPGRGLPRHSHIHDIPEALLGSVALALALCVAVGYYEIISDQARKLGYLVGGCLSAGFSAALYSDGSYLSAGLIAILACVSLATYWRFPSRHESDRSRQ